MISDDGSSDASIAVCGRFAASAPFLVSLQRNPSPPGSSRNFNHSVSIARGDVIVLADQDDVWYPEKLAAIQAAIADADAVFSDGRRIDVNGLALPGTLWTRFGFRPQSTRELVEQRAFLGRELLDQIGIVFEKRLDVGQILEALRPSPVRIRSRTKLLVEKVFDADHPQRHSLENDLASFRDRPSECWIIAELHRGSVGRGPVLRVLEGCAELKPSGPQSIAGNELSIQDGDVDIESRARLPVVNLESKPSDDGVGEVLVREDPAEREKCGSLGPIHFSPQPVPLAVQQESGCQT